jgi:hypothetical protein
LSASPDPLATALSPSARSRSLRSPTLAATEHAEPHAGEGLAGEIHKPAETDGADAETPDLPTEEIDI